MNIRQFLTKPNTKIHLSDFSSNPPSKIDIDKRKAEDELKKLSGQLEGLQNLLYAAHSQKVLIILQGMDTSGKDGVIRHAFKILNPQGVRVESFKTPSPQELDHDYLWRAHKEVPGKGEIVIFNRSYYEDVLVVRVHGLVGKKEWERRYRQINDFEKMLTEENTVVLKFFLHIDKDEQKKRLQERLDDPSKNWKFSPQDLKERKLWDNYTKTFSDMLSACSTSSAPWYIIPANKKWFRDLLVSKILVSSLSKLGLRYPKPKESLKGIKIV